MTTTTNRLQAYSAECGYLELAAGAFKVSWYAGHDKDSSGEILLRFACWHRVQGKWRRIDGLDFCTGMPLSSPSEDLIEASKRILEILEDKRDAKHNETVNALDLFSWINPDNFDGVVFV